MGKKRKREQNKLQKKTKRLRRDRKIKSPPILPKQKRKALIRATKRIREGGKSGLKSPPPGDDDVEYRPPMDFSEESEKESSKPTKPRRGNRDRRLVEPFQQEQFEEMFVKKWRKIAERKRKKKDEKLSFLQKEKFQKRIKPKPINLEDLAIYDERAAPDYGSKKIKRNPATTREVLPVQIDLNASWEDVGGLKSHINKLKEMIMLPLMYPREFEKFKVSPPKGVLFYGPPGTGKTLVSRVLAAEASKHGKKVSFYLRKGADCMSKWIGEAERQLRLLFEAACKNQPSIIFFDEIDGLAPVRSSRLDQVHASVVTTLLSLMDGLDDRGQVIVIGATNRIDTIDPALRRPGRFDRELLFTLPSRKARMNILKVHTKSWKPPLDDNILENVSMKTSGFSGADLEALAREAFLHAFRRSVPNIQHSSVPLELKKKILINMESFEHAFTQIPSSKTRTSAQQTCEPLFPPFSLLFRSTFLQLNQMQERIVHLGKTKSQTMNLESEHENTKFKKLEIITNTPRLLIHGEGNFGQKKLARALAHKLEDYPLFSLSLPNLYQSGSSLEESISKVISNSIKASPSILFWPSVLKWWKCVPKTSQKVLTQLLDEMPPDSQVYIIATAETNRELFDAPLKRLFPCSFHLKSFPEDDVRSFWREIIDPNIRRKAQHTASPLSSQGHRELNKKHESEEPKILDARLSSVQKDKAKLRVHLRESVKVLMKRFPRFVKPSKATPELPFSSTRSLQKLQAKINADSQPGTESNSVESFLKYIDDWVEYIQTFKIGLSELNPQQLENWKDLQNESVHFQDTSLSMVLNYDVRLMLRCKSTLNLSQLPGSPNRVNSRNGVIKHSMENKRKELPGYLKHEKIEEYTKEYLQSNGTLTEIKQIGNKWGEAKELLLAKSF